MLHVVGALSLAVPRFVMQIFLAVSDATPKISFLLIILA